MFKLLQRFGVSQRAIAARTGQSEISEIICKGRQVNRYDVLVRIAEGLGVPRGWMVWPTTTPPSTCWLAPVREAGRDRCKTSTGVEVRLLRTARRLSVREFAAHLGVSDRQLSKWEQAGYAARPKLANQAALSESLRQCAPQERKRFEDAMRGLVDGQHAQRGRLRWCLVVDLPPADVGLASQIAHAVDAVLAKDLGR